MKIKQLLFLAFCGLTINGQAQAYNFSMSTGTYTDLTGSTSLNNGITWDDPEFTIPVGFNFDCFGATITQLNTFDLGGALSTNTFYSGVKPFFTAYGADLIDRASTTTNYDGQPGSLSPISYKLEGVAGNRILKIEWKNAGFYEDVEDDDVSIDYVNFQFWLYEGTNEIEIHFGPNSITQPSLVFYGEPGTSIELFPNYDFDGDSTVIPSTVLAGSPTAPNALALVNAYDTTLTGVIPNGTIYKFVNPAAGVSEISNALDVISLFPNPSNNFFSLSYDVNKVDVNSVLIQNANGKLIKEVNGTYNKIDVAELATGVYFVKVNTKTGVVTKRLIKK